MDDTAKSAVSFPIAKAASALGSAGIAGMTVNELAALIASVLAAIYSALLIGEWVWKRFLRGWLQDAGWISKRPRRRNDATPPPSDASPVASGD